MTDRHQDDNPVAGRQATRQVPPTPDRLRRVLGHFATGVTVVTGLDAEHEPVGFACQSFSSVSLEPPLVLFCADHRGRSWPRMRDTGTFCVNILRHAQQDIVDRFGSPTGARFEGIDWHLSPYGAPALPGVLARVHCAVEAVHASGDHDVVVGRVQDLELVQAGRPLLFYRGRFAVTERVRSAAQVEVTGGWDDFWG
ncbi:MAG: flavin reductase family protein [Intrasporangium sp.]|uniref:flavin reductase family protein n=1 Tax=Intrasporangium sp. TaxID=1925024 RepID=UPI002649E623|nr:flavin reductase family protein [Intrasporangium sp.]MDN5797545.1 flavin reductase family protein [Intrasporangium sp.]